MKSLFWKNIKKLQDDCTGDYRDALMTIAGP